MLKSTQEIQNFTREPTKRKRSSVGASKKNIPVPKNKAPAYKDENPIEHHRADQRKISKTDIHLTEQTLYK